jgi:hypothetical protein
MNHFFVVGFDFGTSYTKVVVRDQITRLAKPVVFGEGGVGLLPSFVRAKDSLLAGPLDARDGGSLITYPKLIAADAVSGKNRFGTVYLGQSYRAFLGRSGLAGEEAAGVVLTRYFLSVLSGVEKFIPTEPIWRDFDPDFDPVVVQIAVPTGMMGGGSDQGIERLFRRSLRAATFLLRGGRIPPMTPSSLLQEAYHKVEELPTDERTFLEDRCITYPEVAAGVQTVFRSRSMPYGKYVTMDVGAGTVDLNVFLRKDPSCDHGLAPQSELHYWSCEVVSCGAAHLGRTGAPVHEETLTGLPPDEVIAMLGGGIRNLMDRALGYQPARSIGTGGSPWTRGTYVYAWGGGLAHPGYESTLVRVLAEYEVRVQTANRLPSPSENFPIPGDVGEFGRFAVAFGLSHHYANLEAVKLPHQIKTFDELYPNYWERLEPDRKWCSCHANPLCPRCQGSGFISRAKTRPSEPQKLVRAGSPTKDTGENVAMPVAPVGRVLSPRERFIRFRDEFEGNGRNYGPSLLQRIRLLSSLIDLEKLCTTAGDQALHNAIRKFQTRHKSFDGSIEVVVGSAVAHMWGLTIDCHIHGSRKGLKVKIHAENSASIAAKANRIPCRTIKLICECRLLENWNYRLYFKGILEHTTQPAILRWRKTGGQRKQNRRPE